MNKNAKNARHPLAKKSKIWFNGYVVRTSGRNIQTISRKCAGLVCFYGGCMEMHFHIPANAGAGHQVAVAPQITMI